MTQIRQESARAITPYLPDGFMKVSVNGEHVRLDSPLIFVSFNAYCAIYDQATKKLYLLPTWDYSADTKRQLVAFIDDFTPLPHKSISSIAKRANDERNDTFILADGWVSPSGEIVEY